MKQINYNIIFKVAIFHSYYENDYCNCLSINLKSETYLLLKRFGFAVKNRTNGIELYSNSSNLPALLNYVSKATGLTSFDFDLITNNDNFTYFTDLPMDRMGNLSYNSQSESNLQVENEVTLIPELNPSVFQNNVGSLSIHFDELIKNADQAKPLEFKINYKARATQWQYFIINRSAMPLVNPKVVGKSGIEFEGPQNITIETGEKALLFSSSQNLIPLSIIPTHKFDLIDAKLLSNTEEIGQNKMTKTIVKGLPTPLIAYVGNKSEIKLVSSPMYVYV
jgi:hypothetical protein